MAILLNGTPVSLSSSAIQKSKTYHLPTGHLVMLLLMSVVSRLSDSDTGRSHLCSKWVPKKQRIRCLDIFFCPHSLCTCGLSTRTLSSSYLTNFPVSIKNKQEKSIFQMLLHIIERIFLFPQEMCVQFFFPDFAC